ncbi:hypothetical protein Cst_c13300 [Thermoclostridium stercorarium subsp. stercorarium DSM 8532]|uniref:Uncharacterized protein n=1 Tax=Thermoclostridium stercorarium (strain ATCC 35414 / DSM 8532 / NCIMB 11754) TaxID=1121335 RepID=L7VPE1_THES1|nr:hypothetical protein Cst_c13300 [Thermoclostridium stercorarium subsp. stercorarium DSM 8532]
MKKSIPLNFGNTQFLFFNPLYYLLDDIILTVYLDKKEVFSVFSSE